MPSDVKFTCPSIDRLKKDCEYNANYVENAVETLTNVLVFLQDLGGNYSELEDLRRSNDELRQWGMEMEDKLQELEAEYTALINDYEELKCEFEYIKKYE